MDIAGNVHRVCEFQQGNVCTILGDVEVRVWDDLAHSQQVVMVIEVLLVELYSEHVGVSDIPKDQRYLFRKRAKIMCDDLILQYTLLSIPCPTLPSPERLTVPHSVLQ